MNVPSAWFVDTGVGTKTTDNQTMRCKVISRWVDADSTSRDLILIR